MGDRGVPRAQDGLAPHRDLTVALERERLVESARSIDASPESWRDDLCQAGASRDALESASRQPRVAYTAWRKRAPSGSDASTHTTSGLLPAYVTEM